MSSVPTVLCFVIVFLVSSLQYTTAWNSTLVTQYLNNYIGWYSQNVATYYYTSKNKLNKLLTGSEKIISVWENRITNDVEDLSDTVMTRYYDAVEKKNSSQNFSPCDPYENVYLITYDIDVSDSCSKPVQAILKYYTSSLSENLKPFYAKLKNLRNDLNDCDKKTDFNENVRCLLKIAKELMLLKNPAIAIDRQIFAAQTYYDLIETHLERCPLMDAVTDYPRKVRDEFNNAMSCIQAMERESTSAV